MSEEKIGATIAASIGKPRAIAGISLISGLSIKVIEQELVVSRAGGGEGQSGWANFAADFLRPRPFIGGPFVSIA